MRDRSKPTQEAPNAVLEVRVDEQCVDAHPRRVPPRRVRGGKQAARHRAVRFGDCVQDGVLEGLLVDVLDLLVTNVVKRAVVQTQSYRVVGLEPDDESGQVAAGERRLAAHRLPQAADHVAAVILLSVVKSKRRPQDELVSLCVAAHRGETHVEPKLTLHVVAVIEQAFVHGAVKRRARAVVGARVVEPRLAQTLLADRVGEHPLAGRLAHHRR
jgi:hypothetical protein